MDVHVAISRCEDYSETVARKTKKVLPTIGRLLLVSTFIEDAIRLMFNTREHADWFANLWGLNNHFAYFLTVVMALNLICGTLFVMLRYKVPASCTVLAVTVFSQVVLYELYSTYHILTRNMSILAAILLLVTENMLRKPQKYSQLPRDENEFEVTSVMLCACRLFLNLMLVSMVHFDMSYKRLFLCLISYSMMFFVWTGYKTRMMSFILSGWLLAYNIMLNDFWNRDSVSSQWVRYDFFQALSAVGGLLLLIHTGPGELSIDEMKKKW
ncbi:hypothetical protein GCK72_000949 [Caenorhabditis remanei]|uniref:Uncharacterized protein n=1 Tax=Caenorhabditis remanei TaxID=31234 RepID=A0A6A5HNF2_CAERE|nr:hypothetical protein GCK72_000949 [Caenorhabditis remanei]KAF1769135.1 hypothetical protein GCK72_000949 [Caenorhabditis remanei]